MISFYFLIYVQFFTLDFEIMQMPLMKPQSWKLSAKRADSYNR